MRHLFKKDCGYVIEMKHTLYLRFEMLRLCFVKIDEVYLACLYIIKHVVLNSPFKERKPL
jgi:hypothetical protein